MGEAEPSERVAVLGVKVSGSFPAPVGSRPAGRGPFGHLDLVGNGPEWCLDRWNKDAYRLWEDDVVDPVNEAGESSWRTIRGYVRERRRGGAAAREGFEPSHRPSGGFRVVLRKEARESKIAEMWPVSPTGTTVDPRNEFLQLAESIFQGLAASRLRWRAKI